MQINSVRVTNPYLAAVPARPALAVGPEPAVDAVNLSPASRPRVARNVCLGTLVALSMVGLTGCATGGSSPWGHQPAVQVYCGTVGGHRCANPSDAKIVRTLAQQGATYAVHSQTDSDRFGRPLSYGESMALLDSGKPIVVASKTLPGKGVFVDNYDDLQLFNNVERATALPLGAPLPPGAARAGQELRMFEGKPAAGSPAVFSQQKKGGFLGIGGHPNRVTAYEGYKELQAGRPLTVVDLDGHSNQVKDFHDLETLYNHQLR